MSCQFKYIIEELNRYHNWTILYRFSCPGSERYNRKSRRVNTEKKKMNVPLPVTPSLDELKQESEDRFRVLQNSNKSNVSHVFASVLSKTIIGILLVLCCLLVPRCLKVNNRFIGSGEYFDIHPLVEFSCSNSLDVGISDDSHETPGNVAFGWKEYICSETFTLPDYRHVFASRYPASWFSNIMGGVSPMYVVHSSTKRKQKQTPAERSRKYRASKRIEKTPISPMDKRRKKAERAKKYRASTQLYQHQTNQPIPLEV